jgi:hypothetical protein
MRTVPIAAKQQSLFTGAGERKLLLVHRRFGDTFVKLDGAWLFAKRNLYIDWIETKSCHPEPP